MTTCHVSNQVADYAFRLGVEQAQADDALTHAINHMPQMIAHVMNGESLTFKESVDITEQSIIDSFECDGVLGELIHLLMQDATNEEIGQTLRRLVLNRVSNTISDHISQNGELPKEFAL